MYYHSNSSNSRMNSLENLCTSTNNCIRMSISNNMMNSQLVMPYNYNNNNTDMHNMNRCQLQDF